MVYVNNARHKRLTFCTVQMDLFIHLMNYLLFCFCFTVNEERILSRSIPNIFCAFFTTYKLQVDMSKYHDTILWKSKQLSNKDLSASINANLLNESAYMSVEKKQILFCRSLMFWRTVILFCYFFFENLFKRLLDPQYFRIWFVSA